jgi:hypothetical protein
MLLRPLTPDEPANWPDALTRPATFTALDSWSDLVRTIYRYPVHRFETEEEGTVTGLLALTHVKHPIFGNSLTTAPFGSYGGFAYADAQSCDLLLEAAKKLANDLGVDHLNLRFAAENPSPPDGWIQHPVYHTYLVDLTSSNTESLLSDLLLQPPQPHPQIAQKGIHRQIWPPRPARRHL